MQTEQYRLLANQVCFHELDYDALRTACVELTKNLLLPGTNAIIVDDHIWLWSWCAELLLGIGGPLYPSADREISDLAATTTRAALANTHRPTAEARERAEQAHKLLDHYASQLLYDSHVILSYMCFPMLEAITRRACSAYVDLSGTVLQPFAKAAGGKYRVGKRCSNVGDMLRLLNLYVAQPSLRDSLTEIVNHIGRVAGMGDGYSTVFNWRNSSLHGETTIFAIGGTIYTLSLIIALDSIKGRYKQMRNEAVDRIRHEYRVTQLTAVIPRSRWTYYPPFWPPSAVPAT